MVVERKNTGYDAFLGLDFMCTNNVTMSLEIQQMSFLVRKSNEIYHMIKSKIVIKR